MKRTDRLKMILELLAATPLGRKTKDMSKKIGAPLRVIEKDLQHLRCIEGKIVFVGTGSRNFGRWCLVENSEASKADFAAISREARLRDKRNWSRKLAKQKAGRQLKKSGFTHSIVRALDAPPLRPAGPPSVWALGA